MKKRFLALLLTLCLLTGSLLSASAAADSVTHSFSSSTGTLMLLGRGHMPDYSSGAPWDSLKDGVKEAIFFGINSFGAGALSNCPQLCSIVLDETIEYIDPAAFTGTEGVEVIYVIDQQQADALRALIVNTPIPELMDTEIIVLNPSVSAQPTVVSRSTGRRSNENADVTSSTARTRQHGSEDPAVKYSYDDQGRVIKIEALNDDRTRVVTTLEYADPKDTEPARTTVDSYAPNGRQISQSVTLQSPNTEAGPVCVYATVDTVFNYDRHGNLISREIERREKGAVERGIETPNGDGTSTYTGTKKDDHSSAYTTMVTRELDADGNVVKETLQSTDKYGKRTTEINTFEKGPDGQRTETHEVTNRYKDSTGDREKTETVYSAEGRTLSEKETIVDKDGTSTETAVTYNEFGDVLTTDSVCRNADGSETESEKEKYTYDQDGNVTGYDKVSAALGDTTYEEHVTYRDGEPSESTVIQRDGDVISGATVTSEYNDAGSLKKRILTTTEKQDNHDGTFTDLTNDETTFEYEYDGRGNPVKTVVTYAEDGGLYAAIYETTTTYNENNDPLESNERIYFAVSGYPYNDGSAKTVNTYDDNGRLTKSETTTYDEDDNQESRTLKECDYDSQGRLTRQEETTFGADDSQTERLLTTDTYDKNGYQTSHEEARFDGSDSQISRTAQKSEYSRDGMVTCQTNTEYSGENKTKESVSEYDANGNTTKSDVAYFEDGVQTDRTIRERTCDAKGNIMNEKTTRYDGQQKFSEEITEFDGNGRQTGYESRTYDEAGNVSSERVDVSSFDAESQTRTVVSTVTYNDGTDVTTTEYTYHPNGNVATQTISERSFDAEGNEKATAQDTTITYNPYGDMLIREDYVKNENGGMHEITTMNDEFKMASSTRTITTFDYVEDPETGEVKEVATGSRTTTKEYKGYTADGRSKGNVTTVEDFDLEGNSAGSQNTDTTVSYNEDGRISNNTTVVTNTDKDGVTTRYTKTEDYNYNDDGSYSIRTTDSEGVDQTTNFDSTGKPSAQPEPEVSAKNLTTLEETPDDAQPDETPDETVDDATDETTGDNTDGTVDDNTGDTTGDTTDETVDETTGDTASDTTETLDDGETTEGGETAEEVDEANEEDLSEQSAAPRANVRNRRSSSFADRHSRSRDGRRSRGSSSRRSSSRSEGSASRRN